MKKVLVIQLARMGDLIQTKRLILSLKEQGKEVHLLVDASLTELAQILYPFAFVHSIQAHGFLGKTSQEVFEVVRKSLVELTKQDFYLVFGLNHSGLTRAISAFFPEKILKGHKLVRGQESMDAPLRMAFRLTEDRALCGINLADIWASLTDNLVPPEKVNPEAQGKGGGIGIVMAGRQARRSLPVTLIQSILYVIFAKIRPPKIVLLGTAIRPPKIVLLGTATEKKAAKDLLASLKPQLQEITEDLSGATTLPELCQIVQNLDLLITPDTGIMHLGAHFGTPILAFFLSSAWAQETGPYGKGHVIWQAAPNCAPCLESDDCRRNLECLKLFDSEEFLKILRGSKKTELKNMLGFQTDFDDLGVCLRRISGNDPFQERRLFLREFLFAFLREDDSSKPFFAHPSLAKKLLRLSDWCLDKPGDYPRFGPFSGGVHD